MRPIDIPAIEQEARELRAAEIHRINGLFAELFSWNPQDHATSSTHSIAPSLERLNDAARTLFSWNPQDRRS
jgi:hypothetical protein